MLKVACLVHSIYVGANDRLWSGPDGFVLSQDELVAWLPLGQSHVEALFSSARRVQQFRLTGAESGLLAAVILITPACLSSLPVHISEFDLYRGFL
ncbi:unnamed protein product [Protopolystoma xenopodis]|uniref:NR LBD domain-containing protein n=1 Tax=Protopolystoma xenopodis TaxID=117903 RepID=A0A448XC97_9PLAT|nr:unnamed protein product [Protopolystoma xenopodis]